MNVEIITQNTFGHFKYLPKMLGFEVIENQDFTIINCGLGSSMFNIMCGAFLSNDNINQKIENVINAFNGQPFAWWIDPTSTSKILIEKLLEHGFTIETTEHAMICDLKNFSALSNVAHITINQVETTYQLEHFIQALEPYDTTSRNFYQKLKNQLLYPLEKLFVGYENNVPVAIGILYVEGDAAGIFSLLTAENNRGLSYGTQMMNHLLNNAQKSGMQYVTLSASSDSGYRIYERLGFESLGQFECFEWKGL